MIMLGAVAAGASVLICEVTSLALTTADNCCPRIADSLLTTLCAIGGEVMARSSAARTGTVTSLPHPRLKTTSNAMGSTEGVWCDMASQGMGDEGKATDVVATRETSPDVRLAQSHASLNLLA